MKFPFQYIKRERGKASSIFALYVSIGNCAFMSSIAKRFSVERLIAQFLFNFVFFCVGVGRQRSVQSPQPRQNNSYNESWEIFCSHAPNTVHIIFMYHMVPYTRHTFVHVNLLVIIPSHLSMHDTPIIILIERRDLCTCITKRLHLFVSDYNCQCQHLGSNTEKGFHLILSLFS